MEDESRLGSALLVTMAAVLWGTTGTAQALAPAAAHPMEIGALRMAVGAAALLAIWRIQSLRVGRQRALVGNHVDPSSVRATAWPILPTIFSAVGLAGYQPLFFTAVSRTGVAVGTIVTIGSAPIFTALLFALFNRRRPEQSWFLATPISIVGLILLAGISQELSVDTSGIFLSLGAGLAFAIFTLSSAVVLKGRPPDLTMAMIASLAALMLLPLLYGADLQWFRQLRGWLSIAHLGLLATAMSYTLFIRGLRDVPPPSAATLSLAEPTTAALLAVFLLQERLPLLSWFGLALVFAGLVVLVITARNRPIDHDARGKGIGNE